LLYLRSAKNQEKGRKKEEIEGKIRENRQEM
jgi:hypothetical protein